MYYCFMRTKEGAEGNMAYFIKHSEEKNIGTGISLSPRGKALSMIVFLHAILLVLNVYFFATTGPSDEIDVTLFGKRRK